MVSLSRSNMVTTLAVFVLLLACSICSGVAAASGAYILLEDGAGNATYPCRGIGGECLSDGEELEFMELQFSQYYLSSSRSLGQGSQGGSETAVTSNAAATWACNAGGDINSYNCCIKHKHYNSAYRRCDP